MKFYWDYFKLGENSYREKMRYFEKHHRYINSLDLEETIDVKLDYLRCLFEVGRYQRFLHFVDGMLEIIIAENIFTFKGEDIFVDLLFKKAACLYHINKYRQAMDILIQIKKIDPTHNLVIELYSMCKRKSPSVTQLHLKTMGMASLLFIIGVAIMKLFIINSHYNEALNYLSKFQIALIVVSLSSFISAESLFQYNMYKEIGKVSLPW